MICEIAGQDICFVLKQSPWETVTQSPAGQRLQYTVARGFHRATMFYLLPFPLEAKSPGYHLPQFSLDPAVLPRQSPATLGCYPPYFFPPSLGVSFHPGPSLAAQSIIGATCLHRTLCLPPVADLGPMRDD